MNTNRIIVYNNRRDSKLTRRHIAKIVQIYCTCSSLWSYEAKKQGLTPLFHSHFRNSSFLREKACRARWKWRFRRDYYRTRTNWEWAWYRCRSFFHHKKERFTIIRKRCAWNQEICKTLIISLNLISRIVFKQDFYHRSNLTLGPINLKFNLNWRYPTRKTQISKIYRTMEPAKLMLHALK